MTHSTLFFIFKTILSGALIASISSLAKVFPKWAAILTALPLMTLLSLIWIYFETKDLKLLEEYTYNVFLVVLPTLIFFIAAVFLFRARVPFEWTLLISCGALGLGILLFEKLGWLKG